MSEESFRLLDELGGFNIVPRGPVNLPKVVSTCPAYRSFCPRGRTTKFIPINLEYHSVRLRVGIGNYLACKNEQVVNRRYSVLVPLLHEVFVSDR